MSLFIFGSLSVLIIAVLLLVTIQIIRVEKTINDLCNFTEAKVKKLYGKK